jgi:hypothetical protein
VVLKNAKRQTVVRDISFFISVKIKKRGTATAPLFLKIE